ncbi:SGNH/GDSL hydrolase family protein [Bacillus mangrovi]|uniref:SGNH/GDSL hydrolase family protein n=1 Tax=Metabacillus mangrovi TaxID=1491830 RepID=A0A7X2S842_9BACI|nr:SGNH/GDSL hydrolase family protein [Metabacillus mangrovi]MTH55397.1 SGNH/GDSL hydrolase family protein [Metabacillus mangrovi]
MKIGLIGDSLTEGRPGISFAKILLEKFPHHTFHNLGKPGESVKSLYTRLSKTELDSDFDLAFLWIGVNDVYSKLLGVQAQPVAENQDEFREFYRKSLELVLASSKKTVAVTPALIGEELTNASNRELRELNALIQSVIRLHPNVHFLNLQSVFEEHLSDVSCSDYISTKVMRVMMDVLFYKKPASIDRLSEKRGLHFTLDGIHLNSAGAQIVADAYSAEINQLGFERIDALH